MERSSKYTFYRFVHDVILAPWLAHGKQWTSPNSTMSRLPSWLPGHRRPAYCIGRGIARRRALKLKKKVLAPFCYDMHTLCYMLSLLDGFEFSSSRFRLADVNKSDKEEGGEVCWLLSHLVLEDWSPWILLFRRFWGHIAEQESEGKGSTGSKA